MNVEDNKLINKFLMIASKIASQPHLMSIRDSFQMTMPLFILAGLAVMVNHVVLPWVLTGDTLQQYMAFGNAITNATLNISTVLIATLIGYNLAIQRAYNNPIATGITAFASLVTLLPMTVMANPVAGGDAVLVSGMINYDTIGTKGMITGIIVGLLSAEVFIRLSTQEKFKINLGDDVPSGVSKAFNVLIPTIMTLSLFSAVNLILFLTLDTNLLQLITDLIQAPLSSIATSLGGYLFLYSLGNLLFGFGIHQSTINGPFTEPFLLQNMNENMMAVQTGMQPTHILNSSFQTVYAQMGGTGATISLIIAILLFSKNKANKSVAKLAVPSGIFEINEPVIFGLPIVFNIPLIIPFVLVPVVQAIIAYVATYIGVLPILKVNVPWITPPVISGWLASVGDIRVPLFQIALIALGVAIYLPFFKIHEKILEKQAHEEVLEAATE